MEDGKVVYVESEKHAYEVSFYDKFIAIVRLPFPRCLPYFKSEVHIIYNQIH